MNRVEPVVAVMLFDVVFAGVSVPAVHLDRQAVGLQTPLRRPALGDRGEDVQQTAGRLGLLRRLGAGRHVDQAPAIQRQGQSAFHIRLLRQQHSSDIGVLDDRNLRRARVLGRDRTSLRPFAGVLKRLQISGVAQRDRAEADAESGLIHHVEHVGKTAVGFADQVSHRPRPAERLVATLAEVQRGVDRSAVAHLVVEPGQRHVIAFADRAVVTHEKLRDDEQRDPAGAGRCSGDLGQHQVDDVLGQFVVAAGDPHL